MSPSRRWRGRPPDCQRVRHVIQSYLDGELPEDDHVVVAEHLRHCQRCGVDERVYRDIQRSLRALATPTDDTVLTRLRAYASRLSCKEDDEDGR